jgi:glycosyltransferase involved in cell wall biosynthesis
MLVICHSYHSFQKDAIEGLSRYSNQIDVLVRTNPFAEISNFLPIRSLERFRKAYKIDLTNRPQNVEVIPTPLWYLPTDRSYKALGKKHFDHVNKVVQRHNLTFDYLYAHFTWSAGYVGARLKEQHGVPFVVTAHGYDIYSLPFKDDEWRERIEYVLNTADHIITVSHSNLECVKKLNVHTPVTIIPNGFRSDLFFPRDRSQCRRRLSLPQDKPIILAVANLEPVKGLEHLIDAIDIMVKRGTDVLCVIVGSGSKHNTLVRHIDKLGLHQNVLLVGAKPHSEIPIWMSASDVVVLSSLKEGNPSVMFEALGCGKPFIGTRVGGIPEIISSDRFGIVVEPGDAGALSQAIEKALAKDWDPAAIIEYSLGFSWESISEKIARVIRSC